MEEEVVVVSRTTSGYYRWSSRRGMIRGNLETTKNQCSCALLAKLVCRLVYGPGSMMSRVRMRVKRRLFIFYNVPIGRAGYRRAIAQDELKAGRVECSLALERLQ